MLRFLLCAYLKEIAIYILIVVTISVALENFNNILNGDAIAKRLLGREEIEELVEYGGSFGWFAGA